MRIKAICIDDTNRPEQIPQHKWVKKNNQYTIIHIFKQLNQNNIQGVSLAEINIDDCAPYNCFKLSRFAINVNDIPNLIELMKQCTGLSEIDIKKLIEELETVEV